jgi:conjugal transfer ATP-binding protein TraC
MALFRKQQVPQQAPQQSPQQQQATNRQQAEIQQQEAILEAERVFQEGVATVKDIIAPAALKVESNYIQLGSQYARTLFIFAYPRFLQVGWFSPIINLNAPLDISMFYYPLDTATIMKRLRTTTARIQSSISTSQEKGEVRDPMLETALEDVENLRTELQQGTEKLFKHALYITIYADSLKQLEAITGEIENILGARLVYAKRAVYQMLEGFNSSVPLADDQLAINNNMNTRPLSTSFPFVSSELTSNDGILYGINRHNNSLVLFDRFSLENANSVIFAKSGAGKSYTVKLEILRSLMLGTDVIVIDPENEYKYLCDATGGTYLNISLNANTRVNPFDLPKPKEATIEENTQILRSAIISVLGLMHLMLGELNPEEEAIMDRAIAEAYAKKDITPESDLRTVEPPLMSDLEEVLLNMQGGESLAARLQKYTKGTFAGIFNQPTNVNMDNQMIVFSIRDLEDQLRPIGMYIVLGYVWNVVRSELRKRILAVDEAWIMMQHPDSAKFLFGLAKRARKYYLGVTTISQDVNDFLNSEYGKAIVTNSSMQLLLKQSTASIDLLVDTFNLTEGEKYLLLESDVGEGIFFAGLKHVAIKVIASYTEDQIITTDPRQLLEIEQAKKEFADAQAAESQTNGG